MKTLLKCSLFVFLFYCSNSSRAQGLSNRWLMGYKSGFTGFGGININFDSIPVIATHQNRKMNFSQSSASISDRQGNLLFYTNGEWIANSENDTMVNGRLPTEYFANALDEGSQAPQQSLIIPFPGDSNIYYLFYETMDIYQFAYYVTSNLRYATIDMRLDSGRGAVTQKAVDIVSDTLITGQLTACKHANGRDWWILCHRFNSNKFYITLFTANGIDTVYSQTIGDSIYSGDLIGQSIFSPDGKKFASYNTFKDEDLNILDFDRCSGTFSNPIHIDLNDSGFSCGVAFSPNSRYLYASSRNYVYQYDTYSSNIDSSRIKIATYDGFFSPQAPFATRFYLAQLASDGKIYINSLNGVQHMHVINFPDSAGLACSIVQHSFPLPAFNYCTMPNYPNYFLGSESGSICDTLQLGILDYLSNQKFNMKLFPNPVEDNFHLVYPADEKTKRLLIIDISGKTVLEQNIPQWSQTQLIDVSKLPDGIYLCRMKNTGWESNCKFIKTSIAR